MTDFDKLIKDCLKGKREAQRQLYDHFADIMLAVCYRYTKSLADAEDVLQEGFVKVFTHLGQYKSEGELGAFAVKIELSLKTSLI